MKPDRGKLSWLCSACFVVQGPEEPGQHAVVVHWLAAWDQMSVSFWAICSTFLYLVLFYALAHTFSRPTYLQALMNGWNWKYGRLWESIRKTYVVRGCRDSRTQSTNKAPFSWLSLFCQRFMWVIAFCSIQRLSETAYWYCQVSTLNSIAYSGNYEIWIK